MSAPPTHASPSPRPWQLPGAGSWATRECLFALLLVIGAVGLRLWDIGRLDPFVDESGYVLASVDTEFRQALDPVAEGKPLLGWLFKHATHLPFDPLLTARTTVALLGGVTTIALGYLLCMTAGAAAALLGMALWALSPLLVFHERLVLLDPIVAVLLALALAAIAVAARGAGAPGRRLFFSALGGGLFGLACLIKISALLALPWFGLVYVTLQWRFQRTIWDRHAALALGGIIFPLLLLGSDLPHLGRGFLRSDLLSTLPATAAPGAHISTALSAGIRRIPRILGWYAGYGGWPLGVLVVGTLCFCRKQAPLSPVLLGLASLATIPVASIVYYSPYARYLIPDQLPLVLLIAVCLTSPWQPLAAFADSTARARGKMAALIMIMVALSGWLAIDGAILRQPRSAPLPAGEIEQYVTGPWSGDGLYDLTRFLEAQAAEQHSDCLVFVHRYSRPGSYGLLLAAQSRPWLIVVPLTLDSRLSLGAAEAVIRKTPATLGHPCQIFILAEGIDLIEPALLRSAGVKFTTVFDHVRSDGRSHFTLLQYEGAPSPSPTESANPKR